MCGRLVYILSIHCRNLNFFFICTLIYFTVTSYYSIDVGFDGVEETVDVLMKDIQTTHWLVFIYLFDP